METLNEEKRKSNLYCYSGEDVTLIYYHRCGNCGTVILEDHSMEECLTDWQCPTCYPTKNFPFAYVIRDELREDKSLGKLIGQGVFGFMDLQCGGEGYQLIRKRREIKKLISCLGEVIKQIS